MALTETMSLQGLPTGAFGPSSSGTIDLTIAMRMQLKPTLLADIKLDMTFGSRSLMMHQILTSSALYLDAPGILPSTGGKPWTEVSLSSLHGGVSPSTLFKQLEEGDPMAATSSPQGLAELLAAAQNARVTGDQVIDGVPTTEYSGTISFQAFLAALPGSERQSLASAPVSLRRSGLPFKIWIDHSHQARKLELRLTYIGVSMVIAVNVKSVNAPVHVSAPPASQVSSG
jgi:LppX_LprAFG lipoprotein